MFFDPLELKLHDNILRINILCNYKYVFNFQSYLFNQNFIIFEINIFLIFK